MGLNISPAVPLHVASNASQLRLSTASGPTSYYTEMASLYDSTNPFRLRGHYNGATVDFLEMTASSGFSGPILKVGQGMSYTAIYTGTSERISYQPTTGHTYENIAQNNWTGNNDLSLVAGQRFTKKGTIADEQKCRIFLGGYTYSGGTIDYVITGPGGSQVLIGQGTITWMARESTNTFTLTGTNVSDQILINANQYTTAGTDNKFNISIRATNGDSHLSIQNRLGGLLYVSLDIRVNYSG